MYAIPRILLGVIMGDRSRLKVVKKKKPKQKKEKQKRNKQN